jgi:hypothetical protein
MLRRIASTTFLLTLALIAATAVPRTASAQAVFQCAAGETSCSNENGSAIYGGYDAFSNTITDTNAPGSNVSNGDNIIAGSRNSLTTANGSNGIFGDGNTVAAGGNTYVTGTQNSVNTTDANIDVTGSGNTVTGSQGGNNGLFITGSSNTSNSSSGNINGVANTYDNVTRGNTTGYFNTVTNASDPSVLGNGNNVSGSQTITVGNNNNNPVAGGGILGNNNTLGPDATNTTILGNDISTDRSNTVDIGDRTISGVSAGVLPTDAVNVQQLHDGIQQSINYTNQQFGILNTRINQAGAAASALGLTAASAAGNPSQNKMALGFANYNGQSAAALAYQHIFQTRHPIGLTIGASFSGGQRAVGGALSFGF